MRQTHTKIRNWERFQHFKDRRPPWIKLYRDLLDDKDWARLDPAAAKMLVMLWLLASENNGELPPVDDIAFRLRMTESKAREILKQLEPWLISERYQDDISPSQENSAADVSEYQETETEEETEREEEKAPRKRTAPPPALSRPDDVAEQVWADWLDLRRKKRAPVTATVLEGARAEAGKAGISFDAFLRIWCVRGSQGLQAEWIKPAEIQQARRPPAESFRERDARLAAERMAAFAPGVAARPVTESFIDVEASYVPALKGN